MSAAFAPLRPPQPLETAFRPAFATAEDPPPTGIGDAAPDAPGDEAAALAAFAEEVRAEGYAAGLAAGRCAAEEAGRERIAAALDGVADALPRAQDQAALAAEEAARDLAGLVLAMLDTALPGLAAERAPDLLQRLAEQLLPRLKLLPAPRFVVAPGLAAALAPILGDLDVALAEDAALPAGDARIEWQAGLLRFDRAARMAALREAFAEAGIGMEM